MSHPFDDAREIVAGYKRMIDHASIEFPGEDVELELLASTLTRLFEYIEVLETESAAGAFMLWNHGMLPEPPDAALPKAAGE